MDRHALLRLVLLDEFGRIVVCDAKKGAENSDARRAPQMLGYGARSGRWTSTEPEAFRLRVGQCLTDGDFVFLYVVRDLDPRCERVIDYLTTRPGSRCA